jgi:hypothetical protein
MRAATDGRGVGDGAADVPLPAGDDDGLAGDADGATTGNDVAGVGVIVLPQAAAISAARTRATPFVARCVPSIRCLATTASLLASCGAPCRIVDEGRVRRR